MTDSNSKHRILIVDACPVFRDGIQLWLNREKDLVASGDTDNPADAAKLIATQRPALVLLDLHLKEQDGIEIITSWRPRFPALFILAVSHDHEVTFGDRALRAGAQGCIMKDRLGSEFIAAIRTVLSGEIYVSQSLAAVMLKKIWRGDTGGDATSTLSERELQVFQLLGSGTGTRQIAQRLKLNIKTIETYREHIKRKLNLKDATSLVHAATTWAQGYKSGPAK